MIRPTFFAALLLAPYLVAQGNNNQQNNNNNDHNNNNNNNNDNNNNNNNDHNNNNNNNDHNNNNNNNDHNNNNQDNNHIDHAVWLEQVYGPMVASGAWPRWADRQGRSKIAYADEYYQSREAHTCNFKFEIVFAFDASIAYNSSVIGPQIQSVIDSVSATHVGSTFGIVSFVDKPISIYGSPDSYCYRLDQALTAEASLIEKVYSSLPVIQGGDLSNNQLGALVQSLTDLSIGWSPVTSAATRLVVMLTPTPPHFALDGFNLLDLPAFQMGIPQPEQCSTTYYPGPEELNSAIHASQTYKMVLVTPSIWQNLAYSQYEWLSSYTGFNSSLVANLDDQFNIGAQVQSAIQVLKSVECVAPMDAELPPLVPTAIAPAPTFPTAIAPPPTFPTAIAPPPVLPTAIAPPPVLPTAIAPPPTAIAPPPTAIATGPTPPPTTTGPTTASHIGETNSTPPPFPPTTTEVFTSIVVGPAPSTETWIHTTEEIVSSTLTPHPIGPNGTNSDLIISSTEYPPVIPTSGSNGTNDDMVFITTTEFETTDYPASAEGCEGPDCPCPEVVIKLKERPKHMELLLDN